MKKLNQLTIEETILGLKKGEFSSVEVTKACLHRINEIDEKIKAFITVIEERALADATRADAKIKELGEKAWELQPLLGVPYACKDNYSTKDIKTTAASNVLKNYVPPFESTVTARLAKAGAVLLGKTNMDAFAHGSGLASDFFQTSNPFDLSRTAGGSSTGSAAAVAAHMAIFAMGSETAGSVRGPAAWNGITGVKPTYGRVSRYGVVAMASSTDSPGPLVKTVKDGALVLEVIAGKDPNDATSSPRDVQKYSHNLDKYSLKGKKIGRPKSYFDIKLEPEVKDLCEAALKNFEELGAEIVEMDLIDPKYSVAVYTVLQRSEVSSNLARLTGVRYGASRTEFGFEAKKRQMLGAYTLSSGYYDAYYARAQRVRTLLVNDFKEQFKDIDFIAGPSMPCIARKMESTANEAMYYELIDVLNEPSSISGLCGISIPCGLSQGSPVGVQLMADMFNEENMLGAAHVFQQSTNFHKEIYNLEIT